MKNSKRFCGSSIVNRKRRSESGVLLVEVMIALGILIIVAVGLMAMTLTAISTTENQGHLAARTAEYAQDKMEQLMSLAYLDGDGCGSSTCGSDTTVFPATSSGGTGLGPGGSSDPNNPAAGYVDYLDQSGNVSTSAGNWFYIRVWQVSTVSTNLKQITITTQTRSDVGPSGKSPSSTVVSFKSFPF